MYRVAVNSEQWAGSQGKERQADTKGTCYRLPVQKKLPCHEQRHICEIWRDQQSIAKRDQIVPVTRNNSRSPWTINLIAGFEAGFLHHGDLSEALEAMYLARAEMKSKDRDQWIAYMYLKEHEGYNEGYGGYVVP